MRILHFEYSSFFRKVIRDMVVSQGHDYSGTPSIDSLHELLAKNEYDVIFTGLELSDGPAEKLLDTLSKTKYHSIPIVILTSSEVKDVTHRLKNLNFSDFILKESLTNDILTRCLRKLYSN